VLVWSERGAFSMCERSCLVSDDIKIRVILSLI
jgi:hypothetical protein